MFKWIIAKFNKAAPSKPTEKSKHILTRQERLHAILLSYKKGKISLETAMDFIYIWRLRSDK